MTTKISIKDIQQGDRRALSKAITLVESTLSQDKIEADKLIDQASKIESNSIRIGITGVPGVGKSTFIDAFGSHLISIGKRVAVLSIDPSSPLRGGSLLGDKTRMTKLSKDPNSYIRPTPSKTTMGGIGIKTMEAILLCEAAGFDVIMIETVGVGQSEYEVNNIVDFFLMLVLPNSGDEIQGIKKGIVELADMIVVNKADGNNVMPAKDTEQHYINALKMTSKKSFWKPITSTCSSITSDNISSITDTILNNFKTKAQASGHLENNRIEQKKKWIIKSLKTALINEIDSNKDIQDMINNSIKKIDQQSVPTITKEIYKMILNKK